MMSHFRNYIELCKPRVVMLMLLTAMVGMCLASHTCPIHALIYGNLGIAMMAGSAAAFNHLAEHHIDALMKRTHHRPLVEGRVTLLNAFCFAVSMGLIGFLILFIFVNALTAILTLCSLVGYAVCYTLYLKKATPQNIVIGGLAGAVPPLLGWTSVTGSISAEALVLVLIIYIWTPPHFWALAIYRLEDYAKANIPMLPLTHGVPYTKLNIVLYTILLTCVSVIPYFINMSGPIYLIGVSIVDILFLMFAFRLYLSHEKKIAIQTFRFSIYYLGILFSLLLVDHYFLM